MITLLMNSMAFPFCLVLVFSAVCGVPSLQDQTVYQEYSPQNQIVLEVDRRLLLNDPQTILAQLEAVQREMQTLKTQMNTQQTKLQTQETTIQTLDTLVNSQQSQIQSLQSQLTKHTNQGLGATYTVWGRKQCPALNGTTTVYSENSTSLHPGTGSGLSATAYTSVWGFIQPSIATHVMVIEGISAGSPFDLGGGAANTLCLTHNPDQPPSDYPTFEKDQGWHGLLYGSEYEFTYGNYAQNDDVPCAVCLAAYSSAVLMIPSKIGCPSGWTKEYRGFLTSQSATAGRAQYEYLCLHENAEYLTEGARQHNDNGRIFYPVITQCGSLPCPPYINAKHVTCVVCSK